MAGLSRLRWITQARPKQIPPDGDWRIWLILAGRGFGKTRCATEDAAAYAAANPGARIAFIASTAKDLRETIMEGPSGLLRAIPQECNVGYNRAFSEIRLWNGSQINGYSAEEPDRLRGPNFNRAYCDELASWQRPEAWDMMNFALRLGENPQCIITTTPRPTRLIQQLVKSARETDSVIITTGTTYENAENVGAGFINYLKEKYEGTRLGRQELYAEVLDDIPGAMWRRSDIEETRVKTAPEMSRIVVAIDPAVSTSEGSDETGIVAAGKGMDGRWYVLADKSGRYTPDAWARTAVELYRTLKADRIIGEVNNGGDMIENTLRNVDRNVPYKAVHASKGKAIRAEPVAALYEQRRVSHVGMFATLEDQMCLFTSDYYRAKMSYSPDRMDACIAKGSLVLTSKGEIPIEKIVVGDFVYTRKGFRKVVAARLTQKNTPVMKISAENKHLYATPDHRIYNCKNGFVRLDTLVCGDNIMLWKNIRQLSKSALVSGNQNIEKNLCAVPASVVQRSGVEKLMDVYDLQIDGEHEFFANGFLVHNCVWALTELAVTTSPGANILEYWKQREAEELALATKSR